MRPSPPTNQAKMDGTVTMMTRVDNTRFNEHVSPQSVTEILREGWNRNDEGLAAADETADYDGMGDPIEPWNGATYAVDKKGIFLVVC